MDTGLLAAGVKLSKFATKRLDKNMHDSGDSVDKDFSNLLLSLMADFESEANEQLARVLDKANLLQSGHESNRAELINSIYLEVHSLKGSARAVNRRCAEALCLPLEIVFSAIKGGKINCTQELLELVITTGREIQRTIARGAGDCLTADQITLIAKLRRLSCAEDGSCLPRSESTLSKSL